MVQEVLGVGAGILGELHSDHAEVAELLDRILGSNRAAERAKLFDEMKAKLLAHSHAEAKVLYARMEKDGEDSRKFALEGDVEHEIVAAQLDALARARAPRDEAWLARVQVLQELVKHHVREEETKGFAAARKQFDQATLEKLGAEFAAEKERRLSPKRTSPARRTAAPSPAYAGAKPKRAKTAKRAKRR